MPSKSTARRIALATDLSPPYIGGMESHAFEAFPRLSGSNRLDFAKFFIMLPEGELVRDLGDIHPVIADKRHLVEALPRSSIMDPKIMIGKIERHGLGDGILFFNSIYWIEVMDALRGKFPALSLIMRSGGNDIMQANIMGRGDSLAERQQFIADVINRNSITLIANSSYSLARLRGIGIREENIRVVSGGVDVSRFRPASEYGKAFGKLSLGVSGLPLLFSAVRLVPMKNVLCTVKALSELREGTGMDFRLIIAGDGPEKFTIQRCICERGLEGSVTLIGPVPFNLMQKYYSASDVYVQTPTYHRQEVRGGSYIHTETMGRSFCEAAAMGLPSVCTSVGGVADIIVDGETGFLAGDGNHRQVAEAMLVAYNGNLEGGISRSAREHAVENLSWEKVFEVYYSIFGV